MACITTLRRGALMVTDYRCSATPNDRPFMESHGGCSVSYVRRGSFTYHYRGDAHEMVAGSVLIGSRGEEFTCTHDHHVLGDECLSFHLSQELAESLTQAGAERSVRLWRSGALPPLPELVVFGELAQACADQRTNIGLDEAGMMFVGRFIEVLDGKRRRCAEPNERNRRRAIETAMWIDANASHEIDLEATAQQAGLSAYHFLRVFGATIGVTPHQYLLRARLRRAARLLADGGEAITEVALTVGFADLSNFVRTFHRAAGVSPRAFRHAARGDRKIFQERLAAFA